MRTDLPIWLGANQMAMVRFAAEVGDGLFGHPIWSVPWTLEHAMPTLEEALKDVRTQLSQVTLPPDKMLFYINNIAETFYG